MIFTERSRVSVSYITRALALVYMLAFFIRSLVELRSLSAQLFDFRNSIFTKKVPIVLS